MPRLPSSSRTDSKPRRPNARPARTSRIWAGIEPAERALMLTVACQIIVLMVFGGGVTGVPAALILVLAAIAVMAAMAVRSGWLVAWRAAPLPARLVLSGIVLVPLIELVPLPPRLWQALPGQELRTSAFSLIGIAGTWQPITLAPAATLYSALMAIVLVTLVVALMTLSAEGRLTALRLILAVIVLELALGVVQVASGGDALRFHDNADHSALVGFFSNKNHMALLLATSLPIAALLSGIYDRRASHGRWLFAGYWTVAVVAVVMTDSRAGVALALVATAAIVLRAARTRSPLLLIGVPLGLLGLAVAVFASPPAQKVFSRFASAGEDLRWDYAHWSVPLVQRYWAFGSGSGSFEEVFIVNERLNWVGPFIANHLHDDYYQVAIEQGLPGITVLAMFILAVLSASFRSWRTAEPFMRDILFTALLVLVLFGLHSIVDYPLRRPATFPVMAMACAMLFSTREHSFRSPKRLGNSIGPTPGASRSASMG